MSGRQCPAVVEERPQRLDQVVARSPVDPVPSGRRTGTTTTLTCAGRPLGAARDRSSSGCVPRGSGPAARFDRPSAPTLRSPPRSRPGRAGAGRARCVESQRRGSRSRAATESGPLSSRRNASRVGRRQLVDLEEQHLGQPGQQLDQRDAGVARVVVRPLGVEAGISARASAMRSSKVRSSRLGNGIGISVLSWRDADLVAAGVDERPVDPALEVALDLGLIALLGQRSAEHASPGPTCGPDRWCLVPGSPSARGRVDPVDGHDQREQIGAVRLAPELPTAAVWPAGQWMEEALDRSRTRPPTVSASRADLGVTVGLDAHGDPLRTGDPQVGGGRERAPADGPAPRAAGRGWASVGPYRSAVRRSRRCGRRRPSRGPPVGAARGSSERLYGLKVGTTAAARATSGEAAADEILEILRRDGSVAVAQHPGTAGPAAARSAPAAAPPCAGSWLVTPSTYGTADFSSAIAPASRFPCSPPPVR